MDTLDADCACFIPSAFIEPSTASSLVLFGGVQVFRQLLQGKRNFSCKPMGVAQMVCILGRHVTLIHGCTTRLPLRKSRIAVANTK